MSKQNINPEILEGLDYETQFIQQHSTGKSRRVQLNRGDSWLLRFIPSQMGPKKQWYARIAQHWLNKKAVFCPRQTAKEWGGDPEAYCPVCEVAERLNADKNQDVSKFGYKLSAQAQWRTWVVVFEKASNGGDPVAEPMSEILRPYEFNLYRSNWEELTGFVRKGARRTALSIFDYELGNDFWLSRGGKGTRLDKEDSNPIFKTDDPKFDEYIAKIEAGCKEPVVKMQTDKQLEDFADKAAEEADNISRPARGGASRGRAQSNGGDEDDLPYDQPSRSRSEEQPRGRNEEEAPRRSTRAPVDEEQRPEEAPRRPAQRSAPVEEAPRRGTRPAPPVEEQQEEQPSDEQPEEQPAPRARRSAPVEEQPARRAIRPAQTQEPETDQEQPPEEQPEEQPAPRQPVAAARPRPSSSTSTRQPAAAPARPAGRTAAPAQENLDADENIPEEAKEQAPPRRLIAEEDDTQPPAEEEAPPPTPRRGALGSNIKDRVAAVTGKK